jgi:hypothetical protein
MPERGLTNRFGARKTGGDLQKGSELNVLEFAG